MKGKLNLNPALIDSARASAKAVADSMQTFIETRSTVTTERTVLRLLGVDGVDDIQTPIPNVVVDSIKDNGDIAEGVAYWMGNAVLKTGLDPKTISDKVVSGELDIMKLEPCKKEEAYNAIMPYVDKTIKKINRNREIRAERIDRLGEPETPLIYVLCATGNIYDDITAATAVAKEGADIISVIRTTAQSLLDYVPYGPTTEGYGGTYATQENIKIMRKAMDDVSEELGRYVRVCNFCSGLCMPEIAAMGALERLDVLLNDAFYGILFRDINMQRTLIDQYFSRVIIGYSGIMFNTGEDNYLTTADAVEEAHTVLASQFLNEQFGLQANVPERQMGLGNAYEMNPAIKDGFLLELAQALMCREIFPEAYVKHMPPTKFMTGNVFNGSFLNALYNLVSIWSNQGIMLLGMMTEAIHTPHLQDRMLSVRNARMIFNNARSLGMELSYKDNGIIQNRAQEVLAEADRLLKEVVEEGLFSTFEQGKFAGIKRNRDGGKGLEGVFLKGKQYFNPFLDIMLGGK